MSNHLITECYKEVGASRARAMMAYLQTRQRLYGVSTRRSSIDGRRARPDQEGLSGHDDTGLIADGLLVAIECLRQWPHAQHDQCRRARRSSAGRRWHGRPVTPVYPHCEAPDRSPRRGEGCSSYTQTLLNRLPLSSADADDPPHEEEGEQDGRRNGCWRKTRAKCSFATVFLLIGTGARRSAACCGGVRREMA